LHRDVVEAISNRYSFAVRPAPPDQLQAQTSLIFQGGSFELAGQKFAVIGIAMVPNGDIVFAPTTELAEQVLDDLIATLEQMFGFRYSTANKTKLFQSNVTVEFATPLQAKFEEIERLQKIINGAIDRPNLPFEIKRLAFGAGDVMIPQQLAPSIELIEQSDFLIERRTGAPYEANRYYCAAPMKTAEHVALLEKIEQEF